MDNNSPPAQFLTMQDMEVSEEGDEQQQWGRRSVSDSLRSLGYTAWANKLFKERGFAALPPGAQEWNERLGMFKDADGE